MEDLLTVLRDREIPLGRDDVQWAFESSKARDEITLWTQEYLQKPSLLSKNELDLYDRMIPPCTKIAERRLDT